MHDLYEIHTAVWLNRLGTTLATVPDDELDRITSYGIDTVWLMGVWERSPLAAGISRHNEPLCREIRAFLPDVTDADIIGSAYAVKSYTIDERFGGEIGLKSLRQRLRDRGMKLVLDFVPNHTSFDNAWITTHPEYYITGDTEQPGYYRKCGETIIAHGADPASTPWDDVAQLNAFDEGYRRTSIDTLRYIASLADGIRCDMAMLLLGDIFAQSWPAVAAMKPADEYWQTVISAVKQTNPEVVFIAESYWNTERQLLNLGFDYCYDKTFYDFLVENDQEAARRHVANFGELAGRMVYFLENHDEPRAATVFTAEQQADYARDILSLPGIHLWYEGQFVGNKAKLPTHIGRGPHEPTNEEIARIYSELLKS